jgi:hypothetical protein
MKEEGNNLRNSKPYKDFLFTLEFARVNMIKYQYPGAR